MASRTDTRERLIECAGDLFAARGYAQTGVARILEAAGARSGSLYYFFPTKEDLLVAVLDKHRKALEPDILRPVFDRIADPVERIFGLLDAYRSALLRSDFAQGSPVGSLAHEVCESHPPARSLLVANFSAWRDAVAACLAGAPGRFPPEVDARALATMVLAVMEGGVMLARAYRSPEPFDAAVGQLRKYFEKLRAG